MPNSLSLKHVDKRMAAADQMRMNAKPSTSITTRDFAKGLGTTLLARLGGVIDVVSQPIYVWLFGLASYGLYAVLWATVNLVENIADLGMTSSLQRVVPQAKDEQEAVAALRSALIIGVIPCVVIAAFASICAPYIAPIFNVAAKDQAILVRSIQLFTWALPLWAFVEITTSALRARRVFGAEIRLRIFWEQLIRLVMAAALYLAGFGIMALFIAHLTSLAVICVLSIRLVSKRYDLRLLWHGPLISPLFFNTFHAGLAVLPANIVSRLFGDAPPIILNILLPGASGATSAALYTIARKISSIVQLVRIAFNYVLSPLASAASRGGVQEVRPIYGFATRLILAIILPLGCTMAAGGQAILDVFGRNADAAYVALIILILARMIEAIFGTAVAVQQVIGGYRQQIVASIIGLSAALCIGIPLVPLWGLTGMAIATGSGFIIAALIPLIQLQLYDRIHPFDPPFIKVVLKTVTIVTISILCTWTISHLPLVPLQLALMLVIALCTIWSTLRFALPLADRMALGKTAKRLWLI